MHELPAAPTAADDRDQFGRPKAELHFGQLLAVTAYWLAITVLWGAFTFSVIPRLVESDGVLGSSSHPLAGLAIGLITTAGVLIAIVVQPTMGAISDHTRSRLGRRKPYILAGTLLDILFLSFAAWAFWNEAYWAFVGSVILLQFSSNFAQGPYQGYIPDLVPGRQVGVASGMLGAANIAGNLLGPGLAILFVAVLPTVLGYPAITLGLFVVIGAIELITMLITVIFVPDRPAPPTTLTLKERALSAWGTDLLAQRDYIWLLVSRLFVLTALVSLQAFAVFFLENAHGMAPDEAQTAQFPLILTVAVAALLSAGPGRLDLVADRAQAGAVRRHRAGHCRGGGHRHRAGVLDGGGGSRADRHLQRRLPGRRLGADDRHHPQGRIGPLHGHQQHRRRRRRDRSRPPSAGWRCSWPASPRWAPTSPIAASSC